MFRLKTFSVIIHVAGWLLFMAFPLLFVSGRDSSIPVSTLLISPYYWLFCATYIALFYLNTVVFLPRYFLRNKHIIYAIICLCLYGCIHFLQPADRFLRHTAFKNFNPAKQFNHLPHRFGPPPGNLPLGPPPQFGRPGRGPGFHHFDFFSFFLFLMVMTLSTAIKTLQQWRLTEQRAISAEAEKASAELSFLKAQINPHFLFNTLNNIYTLAVTNNANTAESIMKLSNIMRYVTDEVTLDYVSLQSEVDCIEDYIALQQLRLGDKTTVNFIIDGVIAQQKIAPLLLMTFVENVFKYGISKQYQITLDISLMITTDTVTFLCSNPVFERKENLERTGIGIANTRQRLQHLYPGRHILNITNNNNLFTVLLTLHT